MKSGMDMQLWTAAINGIDVVVVVVVVVVGAARCVGRINIGPLK